MEFQAGVHRRGRRGVDVGVGWKETICYSKQKSPELFETQMKRRKNKGKIMVRYYGFSVAIYLRKAHKIQIEWSGEREQEMMQSDEIYKTEWDLISMFIRAKVPNGQ